MLLALGDRDGMKLGASALSFFPLEGGIGTGACNFDLSPCDMLIDRPDVDPEGRDEVVPTGEMAFKSEIIFCRLVKASPPPISECFLCAASKAASRAVRGGETCACNTRGADSDRVELAETDRGGALVSIG